MMKQRLVLWMGSLVAGLFGSGLVAMAADGAEGAAHAGGNPYAPIGAAIAISVAALGGALGQGKTAAAALDGIARNPAARQQVFVPMIIGLALIESLVLYGFVIAFLIIKS